MKKVLSIALALAMSLTLLVGCGGGETSTPATDGGSTPAVDTGAIEEGATYVRIGSALFGARNAGAWKPVRSPDSDSYYLQV